MTAAEARDAVSRAEALAVDALAVAQIDGFPEFFYVTVLDAGGNPLVGGDAFVVDTESGAVRTVPASVPPRVNCRNLSTGR